MTGRDVGMAEAAGPLMTPHTGDARLAGSGAGLPLLEMDRVSKRFKLSGGLFQRRKSYLHAVDEVSLVVPRGGSLGLIGESGCGKTTLARLALRLIDPTSGSITFHDERKGHVNVGTDITTLRGRELKAFRAKAQMIFQDPYQSINPRLTVFDAVAEPLVVQGIGNVVERRVRVSEMLEMVGMSPAAGFLFRYPHQLSGGQRQRVAIARALVLAPALVVADEPTSMLDVSVRAGVMQLMNNLRRDLGIGYLYITHDLATARYMCDRIAVMYMGKIVEEGETEALLRDPKHPYTKALLAAVPVPHPSKPRPPIEIKGSATAPIDPVERCRFYDRCPKAVDFCKQAPHPDLESIGDGRLVACYRV